MHYSSQMTTKKLTIQIRLTAAEKDTFSDAAELAGVSMSAWVRSSLLSKAADELKRVGRDVPYLDAIEAQRKLK